MRACIGDRVLMDMQEFRGRNGDSVMVQADTVEDAWHILTALAEGGEIAISLGKQPGRKAPAPRPIAGAVSWVIDTAQQNG